MSHRSRTLTVRQAPSVWGPRTPGGLPVALPCTAPPVGTVLPLGESSTQTTERQPGAGNAALSLWDPHPQP